jgi:hypothetical protein
MFIWKHGDELADLLQKLPPALRTAGDGMTAAGDGALLAGRAMGGGPGNDAILPLREATAALRQVQQQVRSLSGDVRAVADALDGIRLPVVTPTKQKFNLKVVGLGEPELITGLSIGEQPLPILGSLSTRLRSQAARIEDDLAGQLEKTAAHLDRASDALAEAGQKFNQVGDSLKSGGGVLAGFGK